MSTPYQCYRSLLTLKTLIYQSHGLCAIFDAVTTDTEAERNALKEHVYPKLRDFCRENYGIEFQVKEVFCWICLSQEGW
ncbi:NACHT and WD repeat domain-containing protein 2 [Tachysurus ichikawai]